MLEAGNSKQVKDRLIMYHSTIQAHKLFKVIKRDTNSCVIQVAILTILKYLCFIEDVRKEECPAGCQFAESRDGFT